jgi:hypothetical protein
MAVMAQDLKVLVPRAHASPACSPRRHVGQGRMGGEDDLR